MQHQSLHFHKLRSLDRVNSSLAKARKVLSSLVFLLSQVTQPSLNKALKLMKA